MKNREKIVLDIIKSLVPRKIKNSVSINSRLREDLGLDSMKLISLAMNLEEKTGIDLIKSSDEIDLINIITVSDVLAIVNKINEVDNDN